MTRLQLKFACGHASQVDVDKTPTPICGACGCKRVAHVINAPAPRFRGVVRGPHAETVRLEAMAVNLATGTAQPLTLRDRLKES